MDRIEPIEDLPRTIATLANYHTEIPNFQHLPNKIRTFLPFHFRSTSCPDCTLPGLAPFQSAPGASPQGAKRRTLALKIPYTYYPWHIF